MNKKLLFVIVLIIIIVIGILFIKNRDVVSNIGSSDYEKGYSCTKEEIIDGERSDYEVIVYVDKKNKLNRYVVNSTSFLNDESSYEKVCNVLTKEYKKEKYKNFEVLCEKELKSVTTIKAYFTSDFTTSSLVNYDTIKEHINDEFVLDIDSYKDSMTSNGFTCK